MYFNVFISGMPDLHTVVVIKGNRGLLHVKTY